MAPVRGSRSPWRRHSYALQLDTSKTVTSPVPSARSPGPTRRLIGPRWRRRAPLKNRAAIGGIDGSERFCMSRNIADRSGFDEPHPQSAPEALLSEGHSDGGCPDMELWHDWMSELAHELKGLDPAPVAARDRCGDDRGRAVWLGASLDPCCDGFEEFIRPIPRTKGNLSKFRGAHPLSSFDTDEHLDGGGHDK